MRPSQEGEGNRGLTEQSLQRWGCGRRVMLVAQDGTIPLHPPVVSLQDEPVASF